MTDDVPGAAEIDTEQARVVASQLRQLLGDIDTGRIDASSAERAYLAGAFDTLNWIVGLTDGA